jgi:formate hydrogenlyase transcriptional activator
MSTPPRRKDRDKFIIPDSLEAWKELLRLESEATEVGLGILDSDFRFIEVNNAMAAMNGKSAQEHLGRKIREIFGDSAESIELKLEQTIATGQVFLNRDVSGLLSGSVRPFHGIGHYVPIKDNAGEVQQVGIVVMEITEQWHLEESFRIVSETLRKEKKRARLMSEVSLLLATKWDIREIFPLVSTSVRRVLRQEYAALWLRDPKNGNLIRHAMDFPLRKGRSTDGELIGAGDPEGRALREQTALILNKSEMQAVRSSDADNLVTEGMQSLCCVPLVRPKGALGVLALGSTRPDAFGSEDLDVLNSVAAQLAIALENAGTALEVEQLRSRLSGEKRYPEQIRSRRDFDGIVGDSPALQRVLEQVAVVAESDATVLLLGDTGTGKGMIARALHASSKRKNNAFVTLNCAAIPTGLLESELFGHEKGSFTGAVRQKVGRLELADKGTMLLDEIGEISPELQPKLLRVLQDREFERLGGIRTIKVDIRLIAATNRDLARSVSEREFRSDLFYRLNVFPIRVPPLRERREDIPALVHYFVRKFAEKMNRVVEAVSRETMEALMAWDWPGNIRELENFVERSVILTEGPVLSVPMAELQLKNAVEEKSSLESAEREHIIRVLRQTGGKIAGSGGAARRLGVKRSTLQSKMERLGISRRDYT